MACGTASTCITIARSDSASRSPKRGVEDTPRHEQGRHPCKCTANRRNNRRNAGERTGIRAHLTGGFPDNTGEIQGIYRDGLAFSRTPRGEERASRTMGALHRALVRGPSFEARLRRAPQDEDDVWDGRFVVNNNESTRPLSCKRPALWAPGAIPTVDFLLAHFRAFAKKVPVKSLVAAWTFQKKWWARFALPTLRRHGAKAPPSKSHARRPPIPAAAP
jgi:hypothetical protein